jgi:integrase-like protein
VTHLRKIMLEELQRRHYSVAATQRYIRFVERFAQHYTSSDRLGRQHIREYQAQLFTVQKLSPGTVTNPLCALRFFYIHWFQQLSANSKRLAGLLASYSGIVYSALACFRIGYRVGVFSESKKTVTAACPCV